MSEIDSEFELIWEAGSGAPKQTIAVVRDPPRRQFKITRKRIPALQNEQIWRQYHTLSLGRLFKEKLLAIASGSSDDCDNVAGISGQSPIADALTDRCCANFSAAEAESLHRCLFNIINKYGDLSSTVSKADALSYIKKVLRVSSPEAEDSSAVKPDTMTSWRLGCTVKSVSDPKPSKQIPEEGHFFCFVGLLTEEQKASKTVTKNSMQKWASTIPMQLHCTTVTKATPCPVWNEEVEFSVDDIITKFLVVIELWHVVVDVNRRKSLNISFFSGNSGRSAKSQEKLIGRVFLPLQKIALEGEDRCLPLDAKRPDGVAVLIRLCVKGSHEHIATEVDIQDHRLLHRAIVMYENNQDRPMEETCEGSPAFESPSMFKGPRPLDQNVPRMGGICALDPLLPMEGAMSMASMQPEDALMGTSRHNFVWGEELSMLGSQILLAHASWHGIDDLQLAAIELQVLTNCHRAKAMFAMKPFLSHLDRILQKVTRIYEGGSPLSWYQGMQQAPELHMALLGLDAYIQDLLHNHLVMVDLASPAQGTQWLTGLLMTVKKIYDITPYVQRLPTNQQDCQEVLQGSVQLAVQIWMTSLLAKVLNNKNTKDQSGDKAVALKRLSEDCYEKCSKVQLYVVDTFERFGVDYYLIFLQAVDKELQKCSQELIVTDNNISIESSIFYYHAYLACRKIAKSIISTTMSIRGALTIQTCHKWFEPLIGHWICAACNKCQERIEMTVHLDQLAAISEQAHISSSAVDSPAFLQQILQFWQEMDWPPEGTPGYRAELLCCLCSCAEYYMDILYKKAARTKSSAGQFVASKELCIGLIDMQHVCDELCSMLTWFDAASVSHDQACDHTSTGEGPDVEGKDSASAHQGYGGGDELLDLRESRKHRLQEKIKLFVTEAANMLEPHIQRLVHGFMGTPHGRSVVEITDPLCEYLAKNLIVFGEWLHGDLFQIILAGVWETTLQSLGTLLSTLHKRASIIFSPQQFHGILEEISDFFHAKGEGLSVESRHTQNYKSLVEELNLMCLSTRELVLRCCADLAEQQAKALGSPEHKYGELTLSVGYIKEKAALEATVFQARLVEGKKSYHSDTLVYVWLLPQLEFLECAKRKHKTQGERGTLEPIYNHTFLLPSNEDSLKLDGAVLLLGVYNSNSKHLVGVGLVPCKDIPILGEQRLLNETGPKRLRRDITLTQIVVTNRLLYRELAARHSHDHEAGRFFRYLRKKLHMDITS